MIDFEKLKTELFPLLQKAEKARKTYYIYKTASSLYILITVLGFFILPFLLHFFGYRYSTWVTKVFYSNSRFSLYSIIIGCFILFYIFVFTQNIHKKKYKEIEKSIIKTILKKIAPSFKFDEQKQVTSEEIIDSELIRTFHQAPRNNQDHEYKKVYNMNFGMLSGKIGDTTISMGDVKILNHSFYISYFMYIPLLLHFHTIYKYIKSWYSKKTIDPIGANFTGMFATVNFNKRLKGTTLVLPDKFEKRISYLAKILQSLNLRKEQLVNLEDPTFEKEFVVYGTNQVEARYILSPSLMSRICDLQQKVGSSIMLSFNNHKMYIAIEHPYGFLSLNEKRNLITSDALETFYRDITIAIGMVEDLNLNTKIWGQPTEQIK